MADPVAICNQALGIVRGGTITDIGENTTAGLACEKHYETVKLATLELCDWQFARQGHILTEAAPAYVTGDPVGKQPQFDWAHGWVLPADFLCLRRVGRCQVDAVAHEIWGNILCIDANEPEVVYTRKVAEGLFSGLFTLTFAAHLAIWLSYEITTSKRHEDTARQLFGQYLESAQANQEGQRGQRQVRLGSLSRVR